MTPLSLSRRVVALAAIVIPIVGVGFHFIPQGGSPPGAPSPTIAQHVPGELVVQYRLGTGPVSKDGILSRLGATAIDSILGETDRKDGKGDLELIRVPPGARLDDAIRALVREPAVEFAEPNWVYHHCAVSNDTYYVNGSMWGMYGDQTNPTNNYGSQAGEAWANGNTGSSAVYVGVIDEGIMYTHADLSGAIWNNPFDPPDGIDNDHNGYVDDIHGWDFNSNDNTIYDGTTDDHGTHVAGTIGARGGNGMGVAGMCWNVTLISCKFLGPSGGTLANAVKAVDYLTNMKARHGVNIVASNNSWGGGGYSQALFDAINRANSQNILFIAAAGNGGFDGVGDNNDSLPFYPASYTNPNLIAVASITSSGAKSGFSNYGFNSVDIGAPGSSILSTVPYNGSNPSYAYYSGTSMATPHVTGGAALYAATHPGATAAMIKSAILLGAVPTSSLSGKCVTGGRLNVSGF